MNRPICTLLLLNFVSMSGLLALSGCGRGSSGPATYPVEGTVLFEGKPVEVGDIIFFPVDPAVSPEAAKIKDGKYSFTAKEGENRVEIRAANQKTDQKNVDESGKPVPVFESYIPSAYNNDSKLNAIVKPESKGNVFDFSLTKDGK